MMMTRECSPERAKVYCAL